MRVLPRQMALVIRHALLTGLRPSEACESVRLLRVSQDSRESYYNPERQMLQHYLYPEIFLRATKKAYISYITLDNLQRIRLLGPNTPTPTWNSIRSACKRRGIKMNMCLCRRIFASWLIQSGIDSNTVDMLSGRVPSSVLARHYQTPDLSLGQRVLAAVDKLQKEIEK